MSDIILAVTLGHHWGMVKYRRLGFEPPAAFYSFLLTNYLTDQQVDLTRSGGSSENLMIRFQPSVEQFLVQFAA